MLFKQKFNMNFNDVGFSEYLYVENIRRDLLPPISTISRKKPGKPGYFFIRNDLEARDIEVDVRLIENTREDVQRKARHLAGLLYTEKPEKLILRDEPDKFNLAILNGDTDLEKLFYTGGTTLIFTCLDPLAYSINKIEAEFNNNTIIYNKGTNKATGVIKIHIKNNISFLEVKLKETGEKLYVQDNFTEGDQVVIDLENEFITKNGYSVMKKLHLISDFFELPVGGFTIEINNGNSYIEFRERWL